MSALQTSVDPRSATITVRVIRNFEYRTIRNHVFRNIDSTTWTVADLIANTKSVVLTTGGFRPYRTVEFNAAKVYTHAHQTKTQNLVINLDHDEDPSWFLSRPENDGKTSSELGIMNESEISVFNESDYKAFKANPVYKWE